MLKRFMNFLTKYITQADKLTNKIKCV